MPEHFLVTGATGFIGCWIARQLLSEGAPVTLVDKERNPRLLAQILPPEHHGVPVVELDITDAEGLARLVLDRGVTHVIHLAALQVPLCKARPVEGARVNVVGTTAVFEAARMAGSQVERVVYASSAAVAGPAEDYPSGPISLPAGHTPRTLYGVYKLANDGTARIYHQDWGVASIGLRPLVVYGLGREQGLTSAATKAIKAAVVGRPYQVPFGGVTGFNYVEDVAALFIQCARAPFSGAAAFHVRGQVAEVRHFLDILAQHLPAAKDLVGCEGSPLPIAFDFDEAPLEEAVGPAPNRPLSRGIATTVQMMRALHERGALPWDDLET